ncbi:MAG TPA: hypothetical protein VEZ20_10155 [Allosphingosinicella sp.]|nr:hypothetical protein [Allosphingosinicella sp.]
MIADDAVRYARLEAGALHLAGLARCLSERQEHLGMAALYARRRAQAINWGSN